MNSLQYVKYFVHRSEYSTLKRSQVHETEPSAFF